MSCVAVRLRPPRRTPDDLRELAEHARARFAAREAEGAGQLTLADEVLTWAAEVFGERLAATSSMTDGVLAHLAGSHLPGVDVIFLDTGYHFAQTVQTRDQVAATMPVTVRSVEPELSVAQQDAEHGQDLFARDPAACCRMRKVAPLNAALRPYEAWVAGLRREETPSRADTPLVDFDEARGLVKVSPIAGWSQADVQRYVIEHDVPVNDLVEQGYPSIGCLPCTRRPQPDGDERSGRWAGRTKTECGIHQ